MIRKLLIAGTLVIAKFLNREAQRFILYQILMQYFQHEGLKTFDNALR